ncbi:MAG: 16S rRNA (uracil(1498)-N(3))-methyltransferase [Candidatus Margulisbacteria bacterium]|nr:16S rRNA (uracil(1498)-N(3))-methyltransferase [Candidatus Margulisiibacteriota bacterium]
MPRFFVAQEQIPVITGADVHHIRDVLRLKIGDKLELSDGAGKIYEARISQIKKTEIICGIIASHQAESEPLAKVTLAQALPKGQKMDFVIEKGVELGVDRIIPVVTERTIGKKAKLDRWRKLAKEAAEQSGRAIIPEISPPASFDEVLKMQPDFDLALIPWELEKDNSLKEILSSSKAQNTNYKILILIGPEGGFSHQEIDQAKAAGFQSVSLGKRILRTETAGLAALAAIIYELG